jgi:hypothetical protein
MKPRHWMQRLQARICLLVVAGLLFLGAKTLAQDDTAELAKKAQNPVASMISLPFQANINFGLGPYDRDQYILNIQPVLPIRLSENWNLITRTIIPVIYQPDTWTDSGSTGGVGDIQASFFFSPAQPSKVIWGVGPVLQLPSGTNAMLTQGKWGLGPTFVVLAMPGHWVLGVLGNNVWSVGGQDDHEDVNQFLLQYFINYNLPKGWYLTSAPILTANWKAEAGEKWVVPFGGGAGRIFRVGKQPMNGQIGAYYNAEKPAGGPDWQLRIQLVLLFPTAKK